MYQNKLYSPALIFYASWGATPHDHWWILWSAVLQSWVSFQLFLNQLNCGLLLKGVIFLEWSSCCSCPSICCRVSFLVAIWLIENFFPPVSFQLDQLTDLAKSDAAGSLDLTWGKWWAHSTTGGQSEWLFWQQSKSHRVRCIMKSLCR